MFKFRSLLIASCLILGFCGSATAQTFSLGNHTNKKSANDTSVTSDAIDTTSATLLVACGNYAGYTNPTFQTAFSDNKGNTWRLAAISHHHNTYNTVIWYSVPTSVGSGHTFTFNPGAGFPSIAVTAVVGTSTNALDRYFQWIGSGFDGFNMPGNFQPTSNNEIVISCLLNGAGNTAGIDDGTFTIIEQNTGDAHSYPVAMAEVIQTTSTQVSALGWTWGFTFPAVNATAAIASFYVSTTPVTSTFDVVASTVKGYTTNTNVTTDAINTTGATAIVACVGNDGTTHNVSTTFSDSKSNTWTAAATASTADSQILTFYSLQPTVGSGHTFTFSNATANNPVLAVIAVSRNDAHYTGFDQSSAHTADGGNAAGSLTPAATGEFLITCAHYSNDIEFYYNDTSGTTAKGGNIPMFLNTIQTQDQNSQSRDMSLNYLYLSTASAVNSFWQSGGNNNAVAAILLNQGASTTTCRVGALMMQGVGC